MSNLKTTENKMNCNGDQPSAPCMNYFNPSFEKKISNQVFFWVIAGCFAYTTFTLLLTINIAGSKVDKDLYIEDIKKNESKLDEILQEQKKLSPLKFNFKYVEEKLDYLYNKELNSSKK